MFIDVRSSCKGLGNSSWFFIILLMYVMLCYRKASYYFELLREYLHRLRATIDKAAMPAKICHNQQDYPI